MAVQSEHVITSLRNQLSKAHLEIAILEAQLMELGASDPVTEPVLVVDEATPEANMLQ